MISVLIPWRTDNGHREDLFAHVLDWWSWFQKTNGLDLEVCVGRHDGDPFNRGAARNDAFARSSGDLLIVADADTIPSSDGVRAALSTVVGRHFRWMLPYGQHRYYNLSERATEAVLSRPVGDIPEPTDPDDWEHAITSWAGCLVMTRKAWETVGGYDERFVGWGYEDNAFRAALDVLVGPSARTSHHICHLWHPIPEGTNFDQPHIHTNRALYLQYDRARTPDQMRKVLP